MRCRRLNQMVLMGALCWVASPAQATDLIKTEIGVFPASEVAGICAAEEVFIGTVVDFASERFELEVDKGLVRSRVRTDITLVVDLVIEGKVDSKEIVRIPGGTADGLTHRISTEYLYPRPWMGQRYVIAQNPGASLDEAVLLSVLEVHGEGKLPTEKEVARRRGPVPSSRR